MAETDIFNPVRGWSNELGFNPNWSYGWIRKTASNRKIAQPRLGRRYARELANAGYSANLNFIDQPWAKVLYIQRFYQQFKNGYFTLIDWDGGGRHHVGNFTSEPVAVQTANGKWTVQGLTFEEAPQARMLQYPSDFTNASHWVYTVDDYITPLVSTLSQGPFIGGVHSSWSAQQKPGFATPNAPSAYEMRTTAPETGDFAQIQYVGWGFRAKFRIAAGMGQFALYLDGMLIATIDQSNGTLVGSPAPALPTGVTWANNTLTALRVALDAHRVKMVFTNIGAVPDGPLTSELAFPAIQVLH